MTSKFAHGFMLAGLALVFFLSVATRLWVPAICTGIAFLMMCKGSHADWQ